MIFEETGSAAFNNFGSMEPRWSPRCEVCGEHLGREVALDVVVSPHGCNFRLTCLRRDSAHANGVWRHYEISADHEPRRTIEQIALKPWADRGRVAAAVFEWLLAYRLIHQAQGRDDRREPPI